MDTYAGLALEYLKDIVGYDTSNAPGNELPLARYVADVLGREGIRVEVHDIGGNRGNIVGFLGSGNRKLILNGHLDVVPAGEGWTTEPFCLLERGGRMYGRGVCDMKGGIACMMAAAVRTKRESLLPSDAQLVLAFVADEEIDGLGAIDFINTFEKGVQNTVIIGEPTKNQILIAHRGTTRQRIRITGRQCHAGRPADGLNALTYMGRFLVRIDEENHARQARIQPLLPAPSVAATLAHGGTKDNIVAGNAEIVLDFRTVPGDTAEGLMNRTNTIMRELAAGTDLKWDVATFIDMPPAVTDAAAQSVQTAKQAYANVFGHEAELGCFAACCDMPRFRVAGFDTIIFGPGCIEQAHVADEFLDVDYVRGAVDFYSEYIRCF